MLTLILLVSQLPAKELLTEKERERIKNAAMREIAVGENSRFFEAPYKLRTGRRVDCPLPHG